uniref:Ig-like domain-containing protein n=1 Tax=Amphilophus citrinellus TaxID=61819 RepID=A0A3Q0S4G6_AMPCI
FRLALLHLLAGSLAARRDLILVCTYKLYMYCSVLLPLSDQKNIIAVPGQTVTLPCRAPNNNYPVLVVEWSRADLETEYVLFYRDEKLDPEEQHPSFKDRVDLQDRRMKDGDASLVLKDVTVNDTGTYECHVVQRGTNRRTRASLDGDSISTIHLSVVAPGESSIHPRGCQPITGLWLLMPEKIWATVAQEVEEARY